MVLARQILCCTMYICTKLVLCFFKLACLSFFSTTSQSMPICEQSVFPVITVE